MTLLTPVLIYLARLFPLVLLSAAVFVFACDLDIYIVLRSQIFFFYILGVFLALYKVDFVVRDFSVFVVLSLIFVSVSAVEIAEFYGYGSTGYYYDNFVRRPLMVVFSWFFCVWLARGVSIRFFAFLERYVFLFFLSHAFIFDLIGAAFYRVDFLHGNIAYAVIWLISPAAAYLLVVVMRIFWTRLFAWRNAAIA